MAQNWADLIARNKRRTERLFEFTPVTLGPPARRSISVESDRIQKFVDSLPAPATSKHNQYRIAPVPVIDERPERGRERPSAAVDPIPHRTWHNYQTVSGHAAWVTSVAVDPSNEFLATGSLDKTIKFWDLATLNLKMTLTGHIGGVQDLTISQRNPYLYSCCDAKQVLCWDLTRNTIVRSFHGHHSGVYSVALHPTLDILVSGGRDSVARVWDIRTRQEVFVLEGHDMTVFDVVVQQEQPNVVTASADATVRTWDLRMGRCRDVLTRHKKGVRALLVHPSEWCFVSASRDAMFRWTGEGAALGAGFDDHREIINALCINEDNVMVSAGDEGTLRFWDWASGKCFQEAKTIAMPGSIESELGILDCAFDMTGTRLITCETDKTVKMWKEDV